MEISAYFLAVLHLNFDSPLKIDAGSWTSTNMGVITPTPPKKKPKQDSAGVTQNLNVAVFLDAITCNQFNFCRIIPISVTFITLQSQRIIQHLQSNYMYNILV